jgi:uncharacterized protein YnzC (UPF0291/DUF896 family)
MTYADRVERIEELRERERDALDMLTLIESQRQHALRQLEDARAGLVELSQVVELPTNA